MLSADNALSISCNGEAPPRKTKEKGINQNGLLIRLFGTFGGTVIAGVFLRLLEKVTEFEVAAHVLIAFIAVKMGLTLIHIEISY